MGEDAKGERRVSYHGTGLGSLVKKGERHLAWSFSWTHE